MSSNATPLVTAPASPVASSPVPDVQTQVQQMQAAFAKFVMQRRGMQQPGDPAQPTQGGATPPAQPQPVATNSPAAAPAPQFPIGSTASPVPNVPVKTMTPSPGKSPVEMVVNAIYAHKEKKAQGDIDRAQNSMNMFIHAMDVGDMATANLVASPKNVTSWEKYLNYELPRVPGSTDISSKASGAPAPASQGGINQPGGIAVPVDPTGASARSLPLQKIQQEIATGKAQQGSYEADAASRTAEAGKTTLEASLLPGKNAADIDLLNAQAASAKASTNAEQARADYEKAQTADAPAMNQASINRDNAAAAESYSRARLTDMQASGGLLPSERQEAFQTSYGDLMKQRNDAVANLKMLQNKAATQQGTLAGTFMKVLGKSGVVSSYEDQIKQAAGQVQMYQKGIDYLDKSHADVLSGKTSPFDAYTGAYKAMGLNNIVNAKVLDAKTAADYLQKAGGDSVKATELAKEDGYTQ